MTWDIACATNSCAGFSSTRLVGLYGYNTRQKMRVLTSLAVQLEAHIPCERDVLMFERNDRFKALFPPEVELGLDNLGGAPFATPKWQKKDVTFEEFCAFWVNRAGVSDDEISPFWGILAYGLTTNCVAFPSLLKDAHPRVAAVIADFLVSLVKAGKRVLFQTHSLEVFDRLRLWHTWDEQVRDDLGVWLLKADTETETASRIDLASESLPAEFPAEFESPSFSDEVMIGCIRRGRRATINDP